ncbi:major facilitator superfamily domain-containing protein [Trichoderma austrokoningii]
MSNSPETMRASAKEVSPNISRLSNLEQAVNDLEQDIISLGLQNQGLGSLEPPETSSISVKRFWLICFGVCPGLLLSIMDSSVLAASLYRIGVDFQEHSLINWVVLAYTLGYTGFIVSSTALSDVIGQRYALMLFYSLFLAFSAACGFAKDVTQLIIFRTFQGIGGSGLYALPILILTQHSPPHMRQYIGSIIGATIATAGVFGPVMGGLLTQYLNWRWIFLINIPICSIGMAIFYFSWPQKLQTEYTSQLRSWKQFDIVGALLGIAASVLVVFALENAGESEAWEAVKFIVPVTLGLLSWIMLFLWSSWVDIRLSPNIVSVFPITLFRNRRYTRTVLTTLFAGCPYLLLIYSVPMRMQVVSGKSPLIAGLSLLPMLGTVAIGSIISGKMNASANHSTLTATMRVGTALMSCGCAFIIAGQGRKDDAVILGLLTLVGLGFGLCTSAATNMISVEVPAQHRASAHGILAQARILGGSFGITISTACLHHFAINRLADILSPDEFASFDGDVTHFKGDSLEAIRSAFIAAFNLSVVLADAGSWIAYFSTLYGYRFTVKATERPVEEHLLELEAKIARARENMDNYRDSIQLVNRST